MIIPRHPAAISGNNSRITALICLFSRLRTTAFLLTFLLIEMPKRLGRGLSGPESSKLIKVKWEP